MDDIKPAQLAGFAAAALLTFGAAFYLMSSAEPVPKESPGTAGFTKVDLDPPKDPESEPEPEPETNLKFDPKDITLDDIPDFDDPPPRQLAVIDDGEPIVGGWRSRSIWGLPNPAPLGTDVKRALDTLGTIVGDPLSYRFNGVRLDDGSRVPGKPAPDKQELKQIVNENINKHGLGNGFDVAMRTLAPRAVEYMEIQISKPSPWQQVLAVVGVEPNRTSKSYVMVGSKRERHDVEWRYYDWVAFGVSKKTDRVVAIRASMWHVPLIAPEKVPGGRSAPDAAYVKKKAEDKARSINGPPEALDLLGTASGVKVIGRRFQVDAELSRSAQGLAGKALNPDMVRMARELKKSRDAYQLLVVPSKNPPISKIVAIMGETKFMHNDTRIVPGQTFTWYKYSWLEFGVSGGLVRLVRMSVSFAPRTGF
ncbi:MAG: hypothetical protein AB7K24_05035 [Gemmataceae bacterium]